MAIISPGREEIMAVNGYLRAGVVGGLFYLSPSTVSHWLKQGKSKLKYIKFGGCAWVNWLSVQSYVKEEYSTTAGAILETMNLPVGASEALTLYRKITEKK